jgi:hypothetical protein
MGRVPVQEKAGLVRRAGPASRSMQTGSPKAFMLSGTSDIVG